REAEEAQKATEIAKNDAETQRDIAKDEEKKAEVARKKAVKAENEAVQARKKADIARDEAIESKQKEEHKAYIARIGLAAAKIDENAFGSARDLLDGCPRELRNWEWGRLSYLCGLSDEFVDGKAPLESVAFSGDGSKFVTGGWNHSVDIWKTE